MSLTVLHAIPPIAESIVDRKTPWKMSPSITHRMDLKPFDSTFSFRKCLVLPSDKEMELVNRCFNASKPSNFKIRRIYYLDNPASTKAFEEALSAMEADVSDGRFQLDLSYSSELAKRKEVIERWKKMGDLFGPFELKGSELSQVKAFPLWHGSSSNECLAIASDGFTFFGKHSARQKDASSVSPGYFGDQVYFTDSAKQASLCGTGHLLLAWVILTDPYSVISDKSGSEKEIAMRSPVEERACQDSSTYYIPVTSFDPDDPQSFEHYSHHGDGGADGGKFVVFKKAHAIARFWVELAPEGSNLSYTLPAIMDLAEEGRLSLLKTWIEEDRDRLQVKTKEGETLTYAALSGNQLSTLKWLYSQDASQIKLVRNDKKSLPFLSVLGARKEILNFLIDEGISYSPSQFKEEAELFGYTKDRIAKALKEVGWSIWKIPSKPLCFLERRDLLSKLNDKFFLAPKEGLVKVTLKGEEGVGKSSLALAYAHEFQDRYSLVWWIGGGKPLPSGLKDLGIELGLFSHDTPEEEFLKKVFEHLNKSAPWLLILDQIESPSLLDPLFSSLNKGHILITSRDPSSPNSLSIDTFSSHESLDLFTEYTKYPLGEEGEELAKVLSHLPLALNLAGAYMAETGTSYKSYLDAYLQKKDPSISSLHEATMRTVLRISLDHLKATSPEVLPFLYRALYLAPNKIPPSLLSEEGLSPLKCRSFLNLFKRYGLLQSEEDLTTFSIDKLIQKVLREDLSPQEAKETKETLGKNLKKEWRFSGDYPDTWDHAKPLVPHLEAFLRLGAPDETVAASFLSDLGIYFQKVELDLSLSIKYLARSLQIWANAGGKDNFHLVSILNNLGLSYYNLGEFSRAIDFYRLVLEIKEKIYGWEHLSVATTLDSLGVVYEAQGHLPSKIEVLSEALQIKKKVYGKADPDVGASLLSLGATYQCQGDLTQAIEFYNEALTVYEECYDKEHPDIATTLNDLGIAYQLQERFPEAIEFHNKALQIYRKVHGEEHFHVAAVLNNLGFGYKCQFNFPQAIEFYERALEIRKKSYGNEHPEVADSLNNLGMVYQALGNLPQAIASHQQALLIYEKIYGEEDLDVAASLNNLGSAWQDQGNLAQAIMFYNRALEIKKRVWGKEHPDVATTLNNLGSAYKSQGDFPKAIKLYSEALEIRKKTFGEGHPDVAASLNNLGVVHQAQGDLCLAELFHNQAVQIRRKIHGEEHPDVAASLNNLGVVYHDQGKFSEAIHHYNQALQVEKKVYGQEHLSVATTMSNLGKIYCSQGDLPSSIDCLSQALQIRKKIYKNGHSDIVISLIDLAGATKTGGNLLLAIKYLNQALEVEKKVCRENSSRTRFIIDTLNRYTQMKKDLDHRESTLLQVCSFM